MSITGVRQHPPGDRAFGRAVSTHDSPSVPPGWRVSDGWMVVLQGDGASDLGAAAYTFDSQQMSLSVHLSQQISLLFDGSVCPPVVGAVAASVRAAVGERRWWCGLMWGGGDVGEGGGDVGERGGGAGERRWWCG